MRIAIGLVIAACALLPAPARAAFHFMQIEQAVGGVQGDASQQAVQLRMRAGGQNQMQVTRLRVLDATGANPVLLIDFASPVPNAALGDRILIASTNFAARQGPVPDFLMVNTIPPSYLAGGQLVFEEDSGGVIYSLCWGNYSGPSTGSPFNDDDGQYAPCEPGPLPSGSLTALRFTGSASALGTTNASDFALTPDAAVFTNNARVGAAVVAPMPADRGGDCNDTDANVFPGQAEVLGNRIDDDCDGLADELSNGVPSVDPGDADGDGVSLAAGDCNDTAAGVRPGIPELTGDRFDNDCDGLADEDANGNPSLDAVDRDGDGRAIFDRVFVAGFEG